MNPAGLVHLLRSLIRAAAWQVLDDWYVKLVGNNASGGR